MPLGQPDVLKHNNDFLAVVDADEVRGAPRTVPDRAALYALTAVIDKLKQDVTVVTVLSDALNGGAKVDLRLVDINQVGGPGGWELKTAPSDGQGGNGGVAGVAAFNTRTGNVSLTAADVESIMGQGNYTTYDVVNGKLIIDVDFSQLEFGDALPDQTGAEGKVIKSIGGVATWSEDLTAPLAVEAVQAGGVLDFTASLQTRSLSGAMNITALANTGNSKSVRLEITSSSTSDSFAIGGVLLDGAQTEFTVNLTVNGQPGQVAIQDRGAIFSGGYKNIFTVRQVGAGKFEVINDPLV